MKGISNRKEVLQRRDLWLRDPGRRDGEPALEPSHESAAYTGVNGVMSELQACCG